MPSDSEMVGPGAQETNAMQAIERGRAAEAQVYAIHPAEMTVPMADLGAT